MGAGFACLVAVTQSLFDAEELGGGLENHAVNHLLRQMHFVEPDPSLVARPGLLQRDIKPVLLLHRIAAPFVIARLIRGVVQFAVGVMQPFTNQHTARRTANNGIGIVVGEFTAEGRAARAERHIGGGPGGGGAAREQTGGASHGNEEQYFFHKIDGF